MKPYFPRLGHLSEIQTTSVFTLKMSAPRPANSQARESRDMRELGPANKLNQHHRPSLTSVLANNQNCRKEWTNLISGVESGGPFLLLMDAGDFGRCCSCAHLRLLEKQFVAVCPFGGFFFPEQARCTEKCTSWFFFIFLNANSVR